MGERDRMREEEVGRANERKNDGVNEENSVGQRVSMSEAGWV